MRDRRPDAVSSHGVLVDESGRRRRWLRRAGSAITMICLLFILAVVASVFAPDGFVGISLPVIAPAGTTPALPKSVEAPLPAEVLAPVTTRATTTTVVATTTTKHTGKPTTTVSTPSTATTTVTTISSTTTTLPVTTTTKKTGPPTSKPGRP